MSSAAKTVEVDGYGFVVDTESYAGNFERETVAHMTGQVGECGVGDDVAAAATKSLRKTPDGKRLLKWCERHVQQQPDDNGCRRPASIYPTPGWLNDGLGGHYRTEAAGTVPVRARYEAAARVQYGQYMKQAQERAERERAAGNEERAAAYTRDAKGHEESIRKAVERGHGAFPAYQSVMCWLDRRPPAWVVDILKRRAAEWLGAEREFHKPVPVIGYRVVKVTKVTRWTAA